MPVPSARKILMRRLEHLESTLAKMRTTGDRFLHLPGSDKRDKLVRLNNRSIAQLEQSRESVRAELGI